MGRGEAADKGNVVLRWVNSESIKNPNIETELEWFGRDARFVEMIHDWRPGGDHQIVRGKRAIGRKGRGDLPNQ